jgi:hypothetical protein
MTHHPPTPRKLRRASALFLLAAVLSFPSCDRMEFENALVAANRVRDSLATAKGFVGRMKLARLVDTDEGNLLDEKLEAARVSTVTLRGTLEAVYLEKEDAVESGKRLPGEFSDVIEKIEIFKLTVLGLKHPNATESLQPALSMISADLGRLTTALDCESVDHACMKCLGGQPVCKT